MQSHAEAALQQLAAVREQEQAQLTRRAEALQRDFREGIAELEHRYALQVRPRNASLHPSTGRCEARGKEHWLALTMVSSRAEHGLSRSTVWHWLVSA